MVEKTALIGQQPLRKVPPPFRTKQIDAVGQQMLLQDVELGVHDLQQDACLLRQLARAPDEAKSDQGGEQQQDECQPPDTIEGN